MKENETVVTECLNRVRFAGSKVVRKRVSLQSTAILKQQ
jgi:hypothetical protein